MKPSFTHRVARLGLLVGASACSAASDDPSSSDDALAAPNARFDLPLDTAAGEQLIDGEVDAIDQSATIVKTLLDRKYGPPDSPRPVNRANHAVSHGCVSAS